MYSWCSRVSTKTEDEELGIASSSSMLDRALLMAGLSFTGPKEEVNKWVGNFVPILSFIHAFKLRMNELRTGHHSYNHAPVAGKTSSKVSKFGLSERHHIMLEGCTWPPDVQSSMAQSLGPLTVLLKLVHVPRASEYNNKLIQAVQRDYGHFDWADPISQVILNTPEAQNLNVISALAELGIVAPPRNQRRVFIPLIWMTLFCLSKEEVELCTYRKTQDTAGTDIITIPDFDQSKTITTKDNVNVIDFSGKGAYIVYVTMGSTFKFYYPSATKDIQKASLGHIFRRLWYFEMAYRCRFLNSEGNGGLI